ncbi:hypothetical protein NIES4075_10720 [Tolypothrix sp. NIES-4075]|uniref:hypothetical protein n=1 Tax=Tolypothrix sp. NIES-4075 TaxID=2005459 RepID=UPI000B5C5937|nr:hypothetical protein [Tolypothrix sp. NIES-4075]GAX40110.1 hypothetical protein NIES4075_10720 [Tolypothrix sp. NIES-4075]
MKLDSRKLGFSVAGQRQNLDGSSKSYPNSQQKLQASTWVKLLELPSTFSFDEALLLCQVTEDEWLAWIPDHGEELLNTRQFSY